MTEIKNIKNSCRGGSAQFLASRPTYGFEKPKFTLSNSNSGLHVSLDLLRAGVNLRSVVFRMYAETCFISGAFTFGYAKEARTIRVHGTFPYMYSNAVLSSSMANVSTCGLVGYPINAGSPSVFDTNYLVSGLCETYPCIGGPRERVRGCYKALIHKVVNSKFQYAHALTVAQLITQYKRHYGSYADLEKDALEVVDEPWAIQALSKYHEKRAEEWEVRTDVRLNAYCAETGQSFAFVMAKSKLRYFAKQLAYVLASIGVGALLSHYTSNAGWLATIACLLVNVDNYVIDERRLRRDLLSQLESTRTPLLLPASKIYINKTLHPPDHVELPPIRPGVVLEYDERDPKVTEEKVEVYGVECEAPTVYPANTNANLYQALRIRMAFDRETCKETLASYEAYARKLIDQMPTIELEYVDRRDWLTKKYGKARGNRLADLAEQPFGLEDEQWTMFVKGEEYLGKTGEIYKSRMIWQAPDRVLGYYAPYCAQIGKHVARIFHKTNNYVYASGLTPLDVGQVGANIDAKPYKYEADVSSYDGSLDQVMLRVEKYYLETKVISPHCDFTFYITNHDNLQARSKDGAVRIKLKYGRGSGDCLTGCLNSLTNLWITMYINKLTWEDDVVVCVLGDDNIVGLDRPFPEDIVQTYAKLGMKCTVIERFSIYETTFCSGLFWNVDGQPVWGNLPFRCLAKFGVNHNKHHPKIFKRMLAGISKGMLSSAGHVPVVGAFLRALADSADAEKLKSFVDSRGSNPHKIIGGVALYPSEETYLQFAERYNMTVSQILILEEAMSRICINDLPGTLVGPEITQGVKVDLTLEDLVDTSLVYDHEYAEVVVRGPLEEEVHKLKGVTNVVEAFNAGASYGQEEVALGAPITHIALHSIFSLLSYFHLGLGVAVHRYYNAFAYKYGRVPATKAKLAARSKTYITRPDWMAPVDEEIKFSEPCEKCGYRKPYLNIEPANKKSKQKKNGKGKKKGALRTGVESVIKQAVKAALIAGGGAVGGYVGQADLGRQAGAYVSRIIGSGDYKITKNSLMSSQQGVPSFASGSPRSFRFRHKEYIGEVRGSDVFTLRTYPINPGLFRTFPLCSGIANNFTGYQIHGMAFMFVSTSASALNSTNTALGTVIFATQYNPGRAAFSSKIEMEAALFSSSTRPSETAIHWIECAEKDRPLKHLYIRNGDLESGEDQRFYDWGDFQIATQGMQAASTIGELWVTYDIEFFYPRVSSGLYDGRFSAVINNGGYTNNDCLGQIQTTVVGSLPVSVGTSGLHYDRIVFSSDITTGVFLVHVTWKGTSAACTLTAPILTNCSYVNSSAADYNGWSLGASGYVYTPSSGSTSALAAYHGIISINGYNSSGSYITFSSMTLPTSGVSVDIQIVPLPKSYDQ